MAEMFAHAQIISKWRRMRRVMFIRRHIPTHSSHSLIGAMALEKTLLVSRLDGRVELRQKDEYSS